ncbi:MAG: TIGR02270 family protein [Polyangiaceae bacterium]
MINESIVEHHAMEAALLWSLRDAATRLPSYTLKRLEHLDERVEANLDGLRVAGDAGWEISKAALDEDAGEVFASAVLAVERGDLEGIADILDLGGAIPGLAYALAAGLGWAPAERLTDILPGLLDADCPPALHYLGIAGCAAHRMDPGEALSRAIDSPDERVQRCALLAAGELGRRDLLPEVRRQIASESAGVRFAAAWASTLLGDRSAALRALQEIATAGGEDATAACSLAVRRADATTAAGWVQELANQPETRRVAIVGAGALGDSVLCPWLLSLLDDPSVARLAAEAFTWITGIEVAGDLAGPAPKGFESGPTDNPDDEDVAPDPDHPLAWPNVEALRAQWERTSGTFAPRVRRLLGHRIAPDHLEEVLRTGTQPRRAAAALELSLLTPGGVLFEVRAPAFRQRRALRS